MASDEKKSSGRKRLSKLSPKKRKSSASNLPRVEERVPDWLRMLLGKYGETQGKLIGLQDAPDLASDGFIPQFDETIERMPATDESSAELSALLEQMAEDGVPISSSDQGSTSVEWGDRSAPAEEFVGGINDLLVGLGAPQDSAPDVSADDDTDWLSGITGQPAESAEPPSEEDVPDWLSDALETPTAAPEPPPEFNEALDADIPDWLAEEASNAPPTEAPASDEHIPDWLTDSFDAPALASQDQDSLAEADDVSIPDWLTSLAPPSADAPAEVDPFSAAGQETKAAEPNDWDVPDWISAGVAGAAAGQELDMAQKTPAAEDKTDVPDWLKSDAGEAATETTKTDKEVLDWLDNLGQVEPETTSQEMEADSSDADDWLSELQAAPPETQQEALQSDQVETDDSEGDLDWLSELDSEPSSKPGAEATAAKTAPPAAEADDLDWLAAAPGMDDAPESDISEPDSQASDAAEDTNWLSDLRASMPAEPAEEEPDIVTAEADEPDLKMPDWLANPPEVNEVPLIPEEPADDTPAKAAAPVVEELDTADTPEDMPDWLDENAEELEFPEWLAASTESAASPQAEAIPEETVEPDEEAPSWLSDMQQSAVDEPVAAETEDGASLPKAEEEKADWLADIDAEAADDDLDLQMPAWLSDQPADDQPTAEVEVDEEGLPDWLSDLPEADDAEVGMADVSPDTPAADEDDAPDWLSGLQQSASEPAAETEAEEEEADWLADIDAEAADDDLDLQMPAWLSDQPADDQPTAEVEVDEEGLPDWLSDLPEADDAEVGVADVSPGTPAADEDDAPDWLSGLQQSASEPAAETEAEEEKADWLSDIDAEAADDDLDLQMPAWLSDQPADDQPTAEAPVEVDEEGLPAWLSDLPEADDAEVGVADVSPDTPAADEDDAPDWLSGLQQSASEPAAETEAEEEEADWLADIDAEAADDDLDLQMPAWLSDQPADDQPTAEVEVDEEGLPAWLSDLPEADDAEVGVADVSPDTPAADEDDAPDWLSGLQQSASEPVAEAEEEKADWLADIDAEAADDDLNLQMPAWLSDQPADDQPTAEVEVDEEGLPDWLSDLPEADEAEVDVPDVSPDTPAADEDDAPDWLSGLQQSASEPVAEAEEEKADWLADIDAEAADDDLDLQMPDWLSDQPADEQPTAEVEVDEEGLPDWLSDLPEADDAEVDVADVSPDTPAADEDDAPDWLSGLQQSAIETPIETEAEEEEADWLADIDAEAADDDLNLQMPAWLSDQPADEQPTAEVEVDEEGLPDWLSDLPEADEAEVDVPDVSPDTSAADEDDAPDWLADIDAEAADDDLDLQMPAWLSDQPADDQPTAEVEVDEEGLPDWLSDLPEADDAEVDVPDVSPDTSAADEDDAPDWLSGLQQSASEPTAEAEEEEADWLADIDAEAADDDLDLQMPAWLSDQPADDQPTAEAPVEVDEEGLPDWLSDLPEADDAEVGVADVSPDTSAADEDDAPDWLSDLPEADDAEVDVADVSPGTPAADEDDAPDWLSDLPEADDAEVGVADVSPDTPAADEDDAPDWLSGLQQSASEPTAEAEEEKADWLADIDAEAADDDLDLQMPAWLSDQPADEQPTAEVEVDEEGLPDWLSDLPEADDAEVGVADVSPDTAAADEDDAPDWLSGLQQSASEPTAEAEEEEADWLADIDAEAADDIYEAGKDEQDVPDWLTDIPKAPDTGPLFPSTAGASAQAAESTEDVPDWLADIPKAPDTGPLTQSAETTEARPPEAKGIASLDQDNAPKFKSSPHPEPSETEEAEEEFHWPGSSTSKAQPVADEAADTGNEGATSWLNDLPDMDEETPDWLKEIDEESEMSSDDWLTNLRTAPPEDELPETTEDVPDWLTGLADNTEETTDPPTEPQADQNWLSNLQQPAAAPEDAPKEDGTPDWLAGLQISDEETEQSPPSWLSEETESNDSAIQATDDVADDESLEMPEWLRSASLDDLDTPDWLLDDVDEAPAPATKTDTAFDEDSDVDNQPEAVKAAKKPPNTGEIDNLIDEDGLPDWLKTEADEDDGEDDDSPKKPEGGSSLDGAAGGSPETSSDVSSETDETDDPSVNFSAATGLAGAAASSSQPTVRKMTSWLDALKDSEQSIAGEEGQGDSAEATGMLAGVSTLLPSEKVTIPSALKETTPGNLDAAAREFYEIATQPPQPAALPKALTLPERLIGRAFRTGLYLLLLLLIGLPLLPGLQQVVDEESNQRAPWTEPSREFSDVLDSQRRQLISEELGIIDVQPPGAVALVSFDYNTATQGEIQPLAEAVLGRLVGQGMRVIAISLEPEGALIAQKTLDDILAEREETYGDSLVNLGYLPGRTLAVRQLVTGQQPLATIADFKEQRTFAHASRSTWRGVENLEQVAIIVTFTDNPVSARWWVEQLEMTPLAQNEQQYLVAAASASAEPFLIPYRDSEQLDGLITGINGAAAIEAGRRNFGPARQMLDSQSIAHLIIVILIALGTMIGWMPKEPPPSKDSKKEESPAQFTPSAASAGEVA